MNSAEKTEMQFENRLSKKYTELRGDMKILQLGKFFPPHVGGIETFTYNLATNLNRDGVTCDVLCSNQSLKYEETNNLGFNVKRTRSFGIVFSLSLSPQIISELRRLWKNYDIIHAHHPDPLSALALWIVRPQCRIVVTWHSDIIRQRWLAFLYGPLENWLLKRADAIVATSPVYVAGSNALKKFPKKTKVIPLGVDPIQSVDESDIARVRKTFKEKTYFIFSLGRLVPYKGYDNLIKAACFLPDDFQILIGGSGKLYPSLLRLVAELKVDDKVKLLGRVEERHLPLYYNLCDIFCLPSVTRNEAFGLVLPEAMSVGKPIVATNIKGSGVSWVNQHGVTGLNVSVNDPKGLAQGIIQICINDQLKRQFSVGSLQRFAEQFTTAKMADNYFQLYASILGKKGE